MFIAWLMRYLRLNTRRDNETTFSFDRVARILALLTSLSAISARLEVFLLDLAFSSPTLPHIFNSFRRNVTPGVMAAETFSNLTCRRHFLYPWDFLLLSSTIAVCKIPMSRSPHFSRYLSPLVPEMSYGRPIFVAVVSARSGFYCCLPRDGVIGFVDWDWYILKLGALLGV